MVYAIQAYITFPTAQKCNQFLNALNSERAGRVTWGAEIAAAQSFPANSVEVELRWEEESDRDHVWTRLKQYINNDPPNSGQAWEHDCSHDEATPGPCVRGETVSW